MYEDRLTATLIDLIRIPSTSGHKKEVRYPPGSISCFTWSFHDY